MAPLPENLGFDEGAGIEPGVVTLIAKDGTEKMDSWEHQVPPKFPEEPVGANPRIINTGSQLKPLASARPQDNPVEGTACPASGCGGVVAVVECGGESFPGRRLRSEATRILIRAVTGLGQIHAGVRRGSEQRIARTQPGARGEESGRLVGRAVLHRVECDGGGIGSGGWNELDSERPLEVSLLQR